VYIALKMYNNEEKDVCYSHYGYTDRRVGPSAPSEQMLFTVTCSTLENFASAASYTYSKNIVNAA